MKTIIEKVVTELYPEFSQSPYDFTSTEIEAQVRVYNQLCKHVSGNICVNRDGLSGPVPALIGELSPRVRLEWGFEGYKNDIIIFKEGVDPTSYADVEAAIEIKATWGENKAHLANEGFLKDFKFVHQHPDIGYSIIFIANKYYSMSPEYQDFYENQFSMLKSSPEYSFETGQVFLIFRDRIII